MSVETASVNETSWVDYITFWNMVIFLNAVCGIIIFEYSWWKMKRFRNPNKELDVLYPGYRRDDIINWSKWKMYPGAATILLPRMLFLVVSMISLMIWINIFMIGQEEGVPLTGCRKRGLAFIYKVHAHLMCTIGWFTSVSWERMNLEQVKHYEEYLGTPDQ